MVLRDAKLRAQLRAAQSITEDGNRPMKIRCEIRLSTV